MRHLLRSMTLAAVAAAFVTTGGCAPKPIGLRPVDTGAGTLSAARKYLEGRWGLLSFDVHPPGRDAIQVKGEGTLLFDGFGNLEMEIRTDETTGQVLSEAGIPLEKGRLSVTTFTLAAFVTLLPSLPTTQASEGPPSTRVADVSNIKIGNFGQVNANYYRGEQPEDGDYAALAALGIRTVIDLQADGGNDHEAQLVEAAGMTFHRIPMTTRVAPTLEQIAQFMTIVTNPAHQPVYVHCAGGKHRTGVMTAVYRMEHDGWTADQAYREMKRYKFGSIMWHPEFRDFVYHYQPLRRYGSRAVQH